MRVRRSDAWIRSAHSAWAGVWACRPGMRVLAWNRGWNREQRHLFPSFPLDFSASAFIVRVELLVGPVGSNPARPTRKRQEVAKRPRRLKKLSLCGWDASWSGLHQSHSLTLSAQPTAQGWCDDHPKSVSGKRHIAPGNLEGVLLGIKCNPYRNGCTQKDRWPISSRTGCRVGQHMVRKGLGAAVRMRLWNLASDKPHRVWFFFSSKRTTSVFR